MVRQPALRKRSNEMYIVYVGEYADKYADCVTEDFSQAVARRNQLNEMAAESMTARDMTAEIETIRAYRKGQKVKP